MLSPTCYGSKIGKKKRLKVKERAKKEKGEKWAVKYIGLRNDGGYAWGHYHGLRWMLAWTNDG